jgi:hypothetical protein
MRKILDYLLDNSWTWAGTGMVLITLSGPTFKQAALITGVAVLIHSALTFSKKEPE